MHPHNYVIPYLNIQNQTVDINASLSEDENALEPHKEEEAPDGISSSQGQTDDSREQSTQMIMNDSNPLKFGRPPSKSVKQKNTKQSAY